MLLIGGISQANAQISYRSKVIKGSDYVEPYDKNVVRQAMQYKQQIYNNNLSKVANMVKRINTQLLDLYKVNPNEALIVSEKFKALLDFINRKKFDYSDDYSFGSVMKSLNDCMDDVLSRYDK